jgi:hypothetical protein
VFSFLRVKSDIEIYTSSFSGTLIPSPLQWYTVLSEHGPGVVPLVTLNITVVALVVHSHRSVPHSTSTLFIILRPYTRTPTGTDLNYLAFLVLPAAVVAYFIATFIIRHLFRTKPRHPLFRQNLRRATRVTAMQEFTVAINILDLAVTSADEPRASITSLSDPPSRSTSPLPVLGPLPEISPLSNCLERFTSLEVLESEEPLNLNQNLC